MIEEITDGDVSLDEELFLEYRNAKGQISKRRIKVLKSQGALFSAIDLEQNKYLTFRKDRIVSLCQDTGTSVSFAYIPVQSKPSDPTPNNGTICFTGFSSNLKALLGEKANAGNFLVRKSVTKDLEYLCCGPNAGPKKIEKAQAAGIWIMREEEFHDLVDDGVVPDAG